MQTVECRKHFDKNHFMRTGALIIVPPQCFDRFVFVSKADIKRRKGVRQHILPFRPILQRLEEFPLPCRGGPPFR